MTSLSDKQQNLTFSADCIAWAYIFIYLNINLGTLNILPAWIGYKLILSALDDIAAYAPSAVLLRNPGRFLMAWTALEWVMDIFSYAPAYGSFLGSIWLIAGTATAVISIYFHFQLLTNMAEVCAFYGLEERRERFLFLRTINTILQTILSVYSVMTMLHHMQGIAIALLIVNFINTARIFICLFGLRPELEFGSEENSDK